jgi:hypothetical protein
MKRFKDKCVFGFFGVILVLLGFGCASDSNRPADKSDSTPPRASEVKPAHPDPLPAGVTFTNDNDLQNVWLAPGFDFKGYDAVYIGETAFKAVERPNEVKIRALARLVVRDQEVEALAQSGLFKIVTSSTNDIPPNSKTLTLQNSIIEYEKGGGAARYWAGLFGAGQPVAKVRGLMYDGDQLVFVYEARRSGDSAASRVAGVWMSDEEIQRDDIRDMADDLAGFMKRTAGIAPVKK